MSTFEVTELVAALGGEPRMSAALLAERLGMTAKRTMTDLIDRNVESLLRFGGFLSTVAKNPSGKGGRPTKDQLLNEGQAIYLAGRSETPMANEVLIGLVLVFLEWRHGRLVPAAAAAPVAVIDQHRLVINRAYLATLSEVHQATAHARAANMRDLAVLVEAGMPRGAAMAAVSAKCGIPRLTLYNHLRLIRMVPEPDWPAALAPQWQKGALARLADKAAFVLPRPIPHSPKPKKEVA